MTRLRVIALIGALPFLSACEPLDSGPAPSHEVPLTCSDRQKSVVYTKSGTPVRVDPVLKGEPCPPPVTAFARPTALADPDCEPAGPGVVQDCRDGTPFDPEDPEDPTDPTDPTDPNNPDNEGDEEENSAAEAGGGNAGASASQGDEASAAEAGGGSAGSSASQGGEASAAQAGGGSASSSASQGGETSTAPSSPTAPTAPTAPTSP
ncbi:MAG: hypothetical protein ABNH26_03930 [Celeribacter sp.]